jgi:1,4-dihydroxy-2-naphthoate octaprenyltransferase
MEEIQDGAIRCRHCKTTIVVTNPILQNTTNVSQPPIIAASDQQTPWFQITTMITGIVLIIVILITDPWDKDAIIGGFSLCSIQIALGIGAINVSTHGRGMAVSGLVFGVLSFLITCVMAA